MKKIAILISIVTVITGQINLEELIVNPSEKVQTINPNQNSMSSSGHASSLSFDGINDYLEGSASSDLTLTNDFSMSWWVNMSSDEMDCLFSLFNSSSQVFQYMFTMDSRKVYWLEPNATFEGNGAQYSDSQASSGIWTQFVCTYDGSTFNIYKDGAVDASRTVSASLASGTFDKFRIGVSHGLGNYFTGYLDEVIIWNTALSSSEITALYNSGKPISASSNSGNYTSSANVQGYWRFNENSGTTAYDLSGNGNHGTISGATWSADSPIINNLPTAFEWVSSPLDTINITKTNLADTYKLQWDASTDADDGDSINYLVYAKIGVNPPEEIYDTTSTSVSITYQEFLENVFEPFPTVSVATVKFSVSATDGIDTVNVTGDDRVLFVNRYEYLSTEGEGVPVEFALHENYPNPFNPTTTLRFDLPEVSDITLTIYNMLGQRVKTFNMQSTPAGYHTITWNATNDLGQQVGAGVYLYQLQAKDFVKTRKMVLLK